MNTLLKRSVKKKRSVQKIISFLISEIKSDIKSKVVAPLWITNYLPAHLEKHALIWQTLFCSGLLFTSISDDKLVGTFILFI